MLIWRSGDLVTWRFVIGISRFGDLMIGWAVTANHPNHEILKSGLQITKSPNHQITKSAYR
jgi:hypothetical protein